jgi:hypothetical protein
VLHTYEVDSFRTQLPQCCACHQLLTSLCSLIASVERRIGGPHLLLKAYKTKGLAALEECTMEGRPRGRKSASTAEAEFLDRPLVWGKPPDADAVSTDQQALLGAGNVECETAAAAQGADTPTRL